MAIALNESPRWGNGKRVVHLGKKSDSGPLAAWMDRLDPGAIVLATFKATWFVGSVLQSIHGAYIDLEFKIDG